MEAYTDNNIKEQNNPQTANKKKRLVKRYFKVLFITLGILIFIVSGLFWFYLQSGGTAATFAGGIFGGNAEESGSDKSPGGFFAQVPVRTSFLIVGVDDDGTRTDVMIVGCFNREDGVMDLISIPRDTYAKMPKERVDILKEAGLWAPSDGSMKMNTVHHYAGKERGMEFIRLQLEEVLNIKIDYHVKVNLDAFRYVVDEIGGVEFDVPQRMYYRDPVQNLYIDLQPGLQTLDGAQAEGLVRYRKSDKDNPISKGYAQGDLQRVQVQQAFLKALVSQVLKKESLLSNSGTLLNAAIKYVETDFNIADAPKYLKYLKDFNSSSIQTTTIPVEEGAGGYVYVVQPDAQNLIDSIFHETVELTAEEKSSEGKEIIVLNGGTKSGQARLTQEKLEEAGFTVKSIGDFSGTRQDATRILVKKRGMGEDLLEYFTNSEIIVDAGGLTDCDIRIIVGKGE